jgi:Mrp family chromosome partitioning ATPase
VQIDLREMTEEEKARVWPKQGSKKEKQGREPGVAEHLNAIKRVLAVMSGKGGVGKSSVAALLAVALRQQGKRVGVLDADITGPSIPRMFGLHETPPMGPVGILPAETKTGIRVMSINLLLPSEDEAVIWRGPLVDWACPCWDNCRWIRGWLAAATRARSRIMQWTCSSPSPLRSQSAHRPGRARRYSNLVDGGT